MARKKKQQSQAAAGFVPASLETAHASRSNSLPFGGGSSDTVEGPSSFEQYSRQTVDYSNRKNSGMATSAKVAIAVIIIALIAGVSALGFYVYKETQKQAINADLHGMSSEVMEAIDNELTGMTKFDEPFTVLLLGSDARLDDPDMGARTDTIVLCRIDPIQNVVSMVSIPRDTKVEIDGVGTAKFNAAYTYGGPSGTIAAVKELCGVEIDHYAEVNFEGLVGLVDAIGGIDVYVDEAVDDPDAGNIVIPEGEQHLDGAAALVFSRSRQYANGDFTRVSNQRKVIEAIVRKGLSSPASELYGLIQASTEFLTTDSAMDVDFIFSLADQMRHNEADVKIYSGTIPASTTMIDGLSYVIADQYGVDEMMESFLAGEAIGDDTVGEKKVELEDDVDAKEDVGYAYDGSGTASAIT